MFELKPLGVALPLCLWLCMAANNMLAQPAPPPMKMVMPEDCKMVQRLSRNTFYVTGPLRFGRLILRDTKLRRGEKSSDDTIPFDVLEQRCFLNRHK